MDRLELKKFLRIPDEHDFIANRSVKGITTGISTTIYFQRDASGKSIARYDVVEKRSYLDGSGYLNWTKTPIE